MEPKLTIFMFKVPIFDPYSFHYVDDYSLLYQGVRPESESSTQQPQVLLSEEADWKQGHSPEPQNEG